MLGTSSSNNSADLEEKKRLSQRIANLKLTAKYDPTFFSTDENNLDAELEEYALNRLNEEHALWKIKHGKRTISKTMLGMLVSQISSAIANAHERKKGNVVLNKDIRLQSVNASQNYIKAEYSKDRREIAHKQDDKLHDLEEKHHKHDLRLERKAAIAAETLTRKEFGDSNKSQVERIERRSDIADSVKNTSIEAISARAEVAAKAQLLQSTLVAGGIAASLGLDAGALNITGKQQAQGSDSPTNASNSNFAKSLQDRVVANADSIAASQTNSAAAKANLVAAADVKTTTDSIKSAADIKTTPEIRNAAIATADIKQNSANITAASTNETKVIDATKQASSASNTTAVAEAKPVNVTPQNNAAAEIKNVDAAKQPSTTTPVASTTSSQPAASTTPREQTPIQVSAPQSQPANTTSTASQNSNAPQNQPAPASGTTQAPTQTGSATPAQPNQNPTSQTGNVSQTQGQQNSSNTAQNAGNGVSSSTPTVASGTSQTQPATPPQSSGTQTTPSGNGSGLASATASTTTTLPAPQTGSSATPPTNGQPASTETAANPKPAEATTGIGDQPGKETVCKINEAGRTVCYKPDRSTNGTLPEQHKGSTGDMPEEPREERKDIGSPKAKVASVPESQQAVPNVSPKTFAQLSGTGLTTSGGSPATLSGSRQSTSELTIMT